jgi:hypothetical protein
MATAASGQELVFNGIDASTGSYFWPELPVEELARLLTSERPDAGHAKELRRRARPVAGSRLGVVARVKDPNRLDQAGWGAIFAHDTPPAVIDALEPLLQLRSQQAAPYFRKYTKGDGYRPGESGLDFLSRQGGGPGPAVPEKVPYYLMIVGDPQAIPFSFQYELDVQYAVGRIDFETEAEYASYARSVVNAETGELKLPRTACFFGTANPNDRATQLSAEELITPLADYVSKLQGWKTLAVVGKESTKERLAKLLGGPETPAFLFTATHGVTFPSSDTRQPRYQGALLCQEWPGPRVSHLGPLCPEFYFSADNVAGNAQIAGRIIFLFACYGAGTPRQDYFPQHSVIGRSSIAPQAFVAGLPRRLLGHCMGGALAVVGNVERVWGYSFQWRRSGRQLQTFESTLEKLFDGARLGFAMEYFNQRYAELVVYSTSVDEDFAEVWTAMNDARSYIVLGDPAVRLPVRPL